VIIHDYSLIGYVINECKQMTENTRVTVNWIRLALKVTVRYIPAPTVCFILILKQQKTKITHCSSQVFCSFHKKKEV